MNGMKMMLLALLASNVAVGAFTLGHHAMLGSTVSKTTRGSPEWPKQPRHLVSCHGTRSDDDDQGSEEERNAKQIAAAARTDIKYFLTQRSVQSFMFLCSECRDPHTMTWLNNFGNTTNLLLFHGLGAFNTTLFPTWDSYLTNMMVQRPEFVTIRAKRRGAGHGGWSKNNPYIQERFVEFRIDIDPRSIVTRILSVRDHLSAEWIDDLDVVVQASDDIMDSYYSNVVATRREKAPSRPDDREKSGKDIRSESKSKASSKDEEGQYSDFGSPEENDGDNELLFPPPKEGERDVRGADAAYLPKKTAFDRNGAFFLRNRLDASTRVSSALRGGNFDLLVLMSTQEAVHRMLRHYQSLGPESSHIFEFFKSFYLERCAKYFDGSGEHGRADDFVEELLLTPPSLKKDGKQVGIIDPLGLTEKLLQKRKEVALEWQEILKTTPEDHVDLRRVMLVKQMLEAELDAEEDEDEDASKEDQDEEDEDEGSTRSLDVGSATTEATPAEYGEFQ